MATETDNMSPAEMLYAGIQLTRPLLRNITARVEADLDGTGISVGERAILEVLLSVQQATAPEITQILQVKRQLVGRLLKDLVDRKLLNVLPNPQHRTSNFYHLTEQSKAVIEGIRATEMVRMTQFVERFTDDQIRAYFEIQSTINDVMISGYGENDASD
ncbi:MarR family winged helix-turn-helix transcriptional regulator [Ruegeria sp. A3M17]|uniref:MarR family winged helix-turn-helix transcriptional regulator n=1 Tax=Ruegeria sp. A3M17 TaxID=2267229 RepID=UPI000DEB11B4|nr:MarR family winged helix-turn-helix transcriptional regulator [Ruegeria sp. A3M17]RBW57090.1 MarR family transcriptional regulator [Ruegeria sp. A3M17]